MTICLFFRSFVSGSENTTGWIFTKKSEKMGLGPT